MSRGQTPRTPDRWPRMKVRGGRRRSGQRSAQVAPSLFAALPDLVLSITVSLEEFKAALDEFGRAVAQGDARHSWRSRIPAREQANEAEARRGAYRRCERGFHHPPWQHSCDGCWCEGERDRAEYGWQHDTTPARTWDGREDNR